MATAFIIRPFGEKESIDFEQVDRQLLDPALTRHQIVGRTTGDSLRQGNIRTEMFHRLLTADIVIADISLHNANVYYELGIRHALRPKRTFMIRASRSAQPLAEVPFDLRTDRYLAYDATDPAASLPTLIEALRQTLLSQEKDSPVFQLLPGLAEQERAHFLPVPKEFQEAVQRAMQESTPRYQWGDLKLLQTEAAGFPWQMEGYRVVGKAQFRKNAYADACETWEAVRGDAPDDTEANLWLGTVYQRLGKLTDSDLVLRRVVENSATTQRERAEVYALMGRNDKERWKAAWETADATQHQELALRAPFLADAYANYLLGFQQDLNHYYSGINALGLLATQVALADALPDVWNENFQDPEEGLRQLAKRKDELAKLRGSVAMSLEAAEARRQQAERDDVWLSITLADLACLTSGNPAFVATKYRKALVAAHDFDREAVHRQLTLYQRLGVAPANVAKGLQVITSLGFDVGRQSPPPHTLLFTGHRLDAPGRAVPRFPAHKEAEARQAIKAAIRREVVRVQKPVVGIAGGASGGDILFHEVCTELGLETTLYLAMPCEEYVAASVQDGGPDWVDRFNALYDRLPRRELGSSYTLPRWLQHKPNYGIWQRNNLWTLYNALAYESRNTTLIALWDGEQAEDGPGGTRDMLTQAQQSGAKIILLNTKELFGL
jgi:hypothetical protein